MTKPLSIEELYQKAKDLRIQTLRMITKANSGHTGSTMSLVEIVTALYYGGGRELGGGEEAGIRFDEGKEDEKDYVILSKGHGAPTQYAALADLGYFDPDELNHLRQVGALLQGHPCTKIPGITLATGSLGQGFAAAHGLALSLKLDKKPNNVFAVLGDGELQEGIIWETAMSASHYMSDNLVAIIDNNKLQIDGSNKQVMNVEPIAAKFDSFGWSVLQVQDGHSFEELLPAIERAKKTTRKPVCIWCHTIKGKGVPFAENKVNYHGVALSEEELKAAEADICG